MKISTTGIEIAVSNLGFTAEAVKDGDGFSIGFGSVKTIDKKPIKAGETITRSKALELYRHQNLTTAEAKIVQLFDLNRIDQNQFDALVCLVHGIGLEKFVASGIVEAVTSSPSHYSVANIFIGLIKTEKNERALPLLRQRMLEANHYFGFPHHLRN